MSVEIPQKVQWPHGPVSKIAVTAAAAMEAAVWNSKNQITISEMAAAGTLDLDLDPGIPEGAELSIKVTADGTNRVLTLGTGMTGNALTVTASKTFMLMFEFDGTKFINTSTLVIN